MIKTLLKSALPVLFFGSLFMLLWTVIRCPAKTEHISAVGTLLAVVVAVAALFFRDYFAHLFWHPELELGPFQQIPPLFRMAPEGNDFIGWYITIPLTNKGKALALRCEPLLTRVWKYQDQTWIECTNWIPIGLRWALDELASEANQKPTEERSLTPQRPYLFNLAKISTSLNPDTLALLLVIYPNAQPALFSPGRYYFEVTLFCENSSSVQRWYEVRWDGGFNGQRVLEEVSKFLRVSEKDEPPPA